MMSMICDILLAIIWCLIIFRLCGIAWSMFHWTRAIQKVGSHQRRILAKQFPTGPSLGGLSDYLYKENFKAMLQQDQGFPRGDVSLIMDVQADSFTFSYAGKKYSKAEFPGLFQKVWLQVKASFKEELNHFLLFRILLMGISCKSPLFLSRRGWFMR